VDANSRDAQPLEYKQPAGEIRIDKQVPSANLYKKAGVPDKGHAQLLFAGENRVVSFSGAAFHRRLAD
jgi:hypothetical protein